MKRSAFFILPGIACLFVTSCGSNGGPFGGSNANNPLDVPGGTIGMEDGDPYGPSFTPGTFLQTTSPQVSFFNHLPVEGDQANKLLAYNTDVKVISTSGTYAKVEIVDTGEVGYVPSAMLGAKRAPEVSPTPPAPTIVPEVPKTDPLVPELAPEPKSKGIQPPETIDPTR